SQCAAFEGTDRTAEHSSSDTCMRRKSNPDACRHELNVRISSERWMLLRRPAYPARFSENCTSPSELGCCCCCCCCKILAASLACVAGSQDTYTIRFGAN